MAISSNYNMAGHAENGPQCQAWRLLLTSWS